MPYGHALYRLLHAAETRIVNIVIFVFDFPITYVQVIMKTVRHNKLLTTDNKLSGYCPRRVYVRSPGTGISTFYRAH
jgi:hypothetical protein